MIEFLIKPKKAERKPIEMLFIGLFYSSVAFLLTHFLFRTDFVFGEYSGIILILLTVLCCFPFVYFIIKLEEGKDIEIDSEGRLVKEHTKAIKALLWLFLGLTIGFSFWFILFPDQAATNFNAQIKVFCAINEQASFTECLSERGIISGHSTSIGSFLGIINNNIYVTIAILLFSLIFGAGAIFILIWNASVIGAAMGMFSQNLSSLPIGALRYFIHGIPEIAAYFFAALAGGIISVAIIRKDMDGYRKWAILQDAIYLIIISLVLILIGALIEVYLTPEIMTLIRN